jgi:hypothetical protein
MFSSSTRARTLEGKSTRGVPFSWFVRRFSFFVCAIKRLLICNGSLVVTSLVYFSVSWRYSFIIFIIIIVLSQLLPAAEGFG